MLIHEYWQERPNGEGNTKNKCKSCGFYGVFQSRRKPEEVKDLLVRAAKERSFSCGLGRIFGVSHQTALNWIKKGLPDITETLLPTQPGDVLELDEFKSFVYCKSIKCLIWVPLCPRP